MVIIHVAGFQTIAIFMQTGEPERSVDVAVAISDVVIDSPNKVCLQNNLELLIVFSYVQVSS